MNNTNSKNVHIMYLEEVSKWVICEDETGDIVKSYTSEADAQFDYAALRNGEYTIEYIRGKLEQDDISREALENMPKSDLALLTSHLLIAKTAFQVRHEKLEICTANTRDKQEDFLTAYLHSSDTIELNDKILKTCMAILEVE